MSIVLGRYLLVTARRRMSGIPSGEVALILLVV